MSYTTIISISAAGLILVFAVIGLVRGFSKTFLSTFGSLIALICAALLCSATVTTLEKSFGAVSFFTEKSAGAISGIFGDDVLNATVAQVNSGSVANLPAWITNIIKNLFNTEAIESTATLREVIAPIFGYYITLIISFVVLFILFKIVLFLVGRLLNKITKAKIVGRIDRILGFLLGILKGIVVVQLLIAIINIIPIAFFQNLSLEIEKSQFCVILNKFNIINLIINSLTNSQFLNNLFNHK